jgi:hypothetical protein
MRHAWRRREILAVFVGNLKERYHLEEVGVGGAII